jgi:hypothetical protein
VLSVILNDSIDEQTIFDAIANSNRYDYLNCLLL